MMAAFFYSLNIMPMSTFFVIINRCLFGIYIPAQVQLGKNVRFGYGGAGVVIHKNCKIGTNVIISPGVVLGGRGGSSVPIIGDEVFIGPNAVLLGGVVVGDRVVIGANSTVVDLIVPAGAVVLNNKARVILHDG